MLLAILLWVLPPYCQYFLNVVLIAVLQYFFYSSYIAIQMAIIFWKSTNFEHTLCSLFFASIVLLLCDIFKTSFCSSSMVLSLVLSINNSKSFYCGDRFGSLTVLEVWYIC